MREAKCRIARESRANMKRFYRCKVCGTETCLKGRKYCEECTGDDDDMVCSGQPDRPIKQHAPTPMEYAGDTIEDLRVLRQKHRQEKAGQS